MHLLPVFTKPEILHYLFMYLFVNETKHRISAITNRHN